MRGRGLGARRNASPSLRKNRFGGVFAADQQNRGHIPPPQVLEHRTSPPYARIFLSGAVLSVPGVPIGLTASCLICGEGRCIVTLSPASAPAAGRRTVSKLSSARHGIAAFRR